MSLGRYRGKRDFRKTPEPSGGPAPADGARFVVQEHSARRHYFDFRLEMSGVLKSWAVPKGPSFNPRDKRLAVHVEDHPVEYAGFEGVIPAGEYGAGTVIVWDTGRWYPEGDDPEADYRRGRMRFRLEGRRLRGSWTLARMGGRADDDNQWLLVKRNDRYARADDGEIEFHTSVLSGRTLEEVRTAPERFWTADMGTGESEVPEWLPPQLARPAEAPPEGDRWLHEIKLDGYRMACRIRSGRVSLLSRTRKDWTRRFGPIAAAMAELPVQDAWLDGEVAVLLPDGHTDFQALQNTLEGRRADDLVYFLFDLLHLNGADLRNLPLRERKEQLQGLLAERPRGSPLRYSDHLEGRGDAFFEQACAAGLEGIISKDGDRPYVGGRGRDWLKIKCLKRQEFVVAGFTEPAGGRKGLGALLLGVHESGRLRYAGKVGTGFDHDTLVALRQRLDGLELPEPPLDVPPGDLRKTHWVRPALVVEVSFSEWTRDGVVRQASFQGLREDKAAEDVVVERPAPIPEPSAPNQSPGKPTTRVRLSNPDKVLYPDQGLTKRDLAAYYDQVADLVLADLAERPLTLLRCPEGRHRDCFYQKHAGESVPAAVHRVMVPDKDGEAPYLYVSDRNGLMGLVQMGVLEIHPWGARRDRLESPDRMVFDLDPHADLGWGAVVEAAWHVREVLDETGLASFVRTTGGKGLHVVVPLVRRHGWAEVKEAARAAARKVAQRHSGRYTLSPAKSHRAGRVFLDCLRNGMGATAVGNYTTRARPGAPVATPVRWEELHALEGSAVYHVGNIAGRLRALKTSPWEGFGHVRQSINRNVRRHLGLPA